MTHKELSELIDLKQVELGKKLKLYRVSRGYDTPYKVARAYGFGQDAIDKNEKGVHLPSKKTLSGLRVIYELSISQYKELVEMRDEIIKLKKGLKK